MVAGHESYDSPVCGSSSDHPKFYLLFFFARLLFSKHYLRPLSGPFLSPTPQTHPPPRSSTHTTSNTLLTMSQIVPSSFDPFATHPFTNNSGIPPQAPQPYPYPRPIPSAHQQQQQANAGKPNPAQASSLPTAQTPMTMHAPQPQRARPNASGTPAQTRQPVFEPFKLDRSSPDLKDVLAKKSSMKAKVDAKTKAK